MSDQIKLFKQLISLATDKESKKAITKYAKSNYEGFEN